MAVPAQASDAMKKLRFRTGVYLLLVALAGCGGAKVLKEPKPIETTQPLATQSDQRITATLDWVIVRDGPGTWARKADWAEYLLRVNNKSDQPVQVIEVIVVDSLNSRIEPQAGRKQLVRDSRKAKERYKELGIKIDAGPGAGGVLAVGAVAGGAVMGATASAGMIGGAGAGMAAGAVVVLVPVLAVGGVARGLNHSKVNEQIGLRQTLLPLEIPAAEEHELDLFYPLAPSPQRVEVTYTDNTGDHTLVIDTSTALNGLHIVEENE